MLQSFEKKISVIVPIFNAELYLLKCINSILKQTYTNLQIILIDDGSTDTSGKICDRYTKLDCRVEVFHTKNNGLVVARKLGLEMSRGEYIGFVDADDYIEPNMFYELINNMEKNDVDFVHCGFIANEYSSKILLNNFEDEVISFVDFQSKEDFLCEYIFTQKNITPSIWSKLFKADFIKNCYKNIPDNQQYGEDLICLCWCVLEGKRISLCKKTLYNYTIRETSLSHLNKNEYVEKEISLWYCVLNVLNEYGCSQIVKQNMYIFFRERILCVANIIKNKEVSITRYYFKNISQIFGRKIVLYGAGDVGKDYYAQICKYKYCQIVAWVDLHWYKYQFDYARVISIENMIKLDFDLVVIAVMKEKIRIEIKDYLVNIGIPTNKIYYQEPGCYF